MYWQETLTGFIKEVRVLYNEYTINTSIDLKLEKLVYILVKFVINVV